ncbi:Protein of unknown function [Gryllus bimaculatus]|nr:Protein of unknown function [Gryllus bimaculatus]
MADSRCWRLNMNQRCQQSSYYSQRRRHVVSLAPGPSGRPLPPSANSLVDRDGGALATGYEDSLPGNSEIYKAHVGLHDVKRFFDLVYGVGRFYT